MNSATFERVRQIVADVMRVPLADVTPASSPDSISSWDSIQHLNLILALEQGFSVQFDPEHVEQILSVELAVLTIDELIGQDKAGRGG
jgi:acyl carrier protein